MEARTAGTADSVRRELVVLSNRLPYTLEAGADGLRLRPAVSGLVSAVEPVLRRTGGVWIGWGGRTAAPAGEDPQAREDPQVLVPPGGLGYRLQEIRIPEPEFRAYYDGFANGSLWPLCHQFIDRASFDPAHWEAYVAVNRRFAAAALPWLRSGRLAWVHDFHLALVPRQLRAQAPGARIAFFWHIPFPPHEILATLPWARELLAGLLGADLVAFHTGDYVHNFCRCAERLLGARAEEEAGRIHWQGRVIRVQALPIGVDWQTFQDLAQSDRIQARARAIRAAVGTPVILLGVERLDYTKGIPERLQAFGRFLERYPEFQGRVTLLQIGVPTRDRLQAYQELRRRVEEAVGWLSGRYSQNWQPPVRYQARSVDREELVAHYLAADVGLVTPLRDGLNLVAKEYVASRVDGDGVLVLSPFAGAAADLPEALPGNPYHPEELAAAIHKAITMPEPERRRRMAALRERVRQKDLAWWWEETLKALGEVGGAAAPRAVARPGAGRTGARRRPSRNQALATQDDLLVAKEVKPGGLPTAAGSGRP